MCFKLAGNENDKFHFELPIVFALVSCTLSGTCIHQCYYHHMFSQGGWTPLHNASYGGYADMVEFLLNHSADVNAKNDVSDHVFKHVLCLHN